MAALVLWRHLTRTDFNAMNGLAAPGGSGGGAMHIALGKQAYDFDVNEFLRVGGRNSVAIDAHSRQGATGTLYFAGSPRRRGGEWIIRHQYHGRHPAWSASEGFPAAFDSADHPVVLVFRVGSAYHARLSTSKKLAAVPKHIAPEGIQTSKGIAVASPELLALFSVPAETLLDRFHTEVEETAAIDFDPLNIEDGRRRIFGSVLLRQGQANFRKTLFDVYASGCAITGCRTSWVLEAAHIVPYRGSKTNIASNGLLLRADVHTLFDLGLISVEPVVRKVRVSSLLARSEYAELSGKKLRPPTVPSARPADKALEYHYSLFQP